MKKMIGFKLTGSAEALGEYLKERKVRTAGSCLLMAAAGDSRYPMAEARLGGWCLLSFILAAVIITCIEFYRRAKRISKLENNLNNHEVRLNSLQQEKEWLVREINHRVKNNLQMVTSLLNNQVAYLKSEEALQAIAISQHRLFTISLAYQKLYKNESLSTIDIPHYITELTGYLKDELQANENIRFDLQIDEADLVVTAVVPLGLIINEAVSNAIKYAFPNDAPGELRISFSAEQGGWFRLVIADNGIGLPAGFELNDGKSLGTSLISGLCEQLGGKLTLNNEKGVSITVEFTNLKPASRYLD